MKLLWFYALLPTLPFVLGIGGGRNRIEIVITAVTKGLESGLRGAIQGIRNFGSGLRALGTTAAQVWSGITQGVFFTVNAIRELINIGKALFDVFLGGAIQAERIQVTFENMTGSAEQAAQMMDILDQRAQSLGQRFEDVAIAGQQFAIAARDAEGNIDLDKWQELMDITSNLSALRPDVPFQLMARGVTAALQGDMSTLTRLLDVNVNQLLGLKDEADEVIKRGGQLQGVAEIAAGEVEDAAQGGLDTLQALQEALGATGLAAKQANETVAGTAGQVREEIKSTLRDLGEEMLPTLRDILVEILDLWRENEDQITAFGLALTDMFTAMAQDIDWEQVGATIDLIFQDLQTLSAGGTPEGPLAGPVNTARGIGETGRFFGEFGQLLGGNQNWQQFRQDVGSGESLLGFRSFSEIFGGGGQPVQIQISMHENARDFVQAEVVNGVGQVMGGGSSGKPVPPTSTSQNGSGSKR